VRVLVTRPQADAERTAIRLAALGHDSVVAPVLSIERTGHAAPPGPFDALIVTSVNAVPALSELEGRALPVFAVGDRTAAAVATAGFADVYAADGEATALAALIAQKLRPGAHLLHVAGRDRKPEPGVSLRTAGFQIEAWTVYAAHAAKRLPDAARVALQELWLDTALHYSRRSVTILLDLVRASGLVRPFLALEHLCLSSDVAAPLREAGAQRIIAAERPNEEALLAKFNRGGPHRKDRRKTQPGARDGTNPPAEVSLSSSPPEEAVVTEPPPDTSDPRPRRTGPYREPPTIDLKATVVPDEPARPSDESKIATGTPSEAAAHREAAKSGEGSPSDAAPMQSGEPVATDPSGPAVGSVKSDSPSTEASASAVEAVADTDRPKAGPSSETSEVTVADAPAVKVETPDETPQVAAQALPASGDAASDRAPTDDIRIKTASIDRGVTEGAQPETPSEDRAVTDAAQAQAATAAAPEPAPPPRPERRRGLGAGALLGTGLLGGLVGAGLATLGQTYWSRSQNDPRLQQLEQRLGSVPSRETVGTLERRLAALDAEQKSLNERLRGAQPDVGPNPASGAPAEGAPAPKSPDVAPALAALTERLSTLEAKAPDVAPALAALTERFSLLEADVRGLAPLRDQVQANLEATRSLDQRLSDLQGQVRTTIDAAVRGLDQRLTAALGQTRDQLRDQIQANAEATRTLERRSVEQDQRLTALAQRVGDRNPAEVAATALHVTLADRLGSALRTGAPLGPSLDALRRQNADPQALAALEPFAAQGAPNAAALAQSFKPFGDRIIAESRPASSNAGWTDRLWRMADQVVTVRAADDKGGNDVPSLIARIQTALANGSLREAAAAWDVLPEPARHLSEDWGRRLKQRIAAEEAVQKISDRALSALDASTR
jgi:uroporphyrinogen-III synthase